MLLNEKDSHGAQSDYASTVADEPQPAELDGSDLKFAQYCVLRRPNGSTWELGRGAMGVTYKAFDEQLRVDVALKLITPGQVDDPKAKALFLREARAAARVRHPNVASVLFLSTTPGNLFYAMEFIAGESLQDWLRARGAIAPRVAVSFALQIARGLEAIHAQQIVHRDLKPANLMIVPTGRGKSGQPVEANPDAWQIKIIDFGLARGFGGGRLGTELDAQTIGFRGTALYASPEQCEERGEIDGRSDQYSLGCILWEMLTGAPPFRARTHRELLNQHVAQAAPLAGISHLPASLQAVLARLLEKDPANRFANADELVQALARCLERMQAGEHGTADPGLTTRESDAMVSAGPGRDVAFRRGRLWRTAVGIGVLVLTGAGSYWIFGTKQTGTPRPATTDPRAPPALATPAPAPQPALLRKAIAVLPFVNLSADKGDEYLGDGMTEELLNVLAKVRGLRVPGRTSSFAFKGRTEDGIFRKVGEELHVDTVLEGSVRKAGDKLRITAQLINVADGYHLWSESYDGNMQDILALQSDVAQRVVRALQMQLGVEDARALTKKPTENPEAYRLYLLGRFHFAKFTQAGWTNAIRYFEQALQMDPSFALAYCGLADTYGWCGGQLLSGREAWAKVRDLALKALVLDPNLAEAHLSLAVALFSALEDFPGSDKELDRALELNPNLAPAYDQYGLNLMAYGRFDDAIAKVKKALELDPLNPLFNADLGIFLQWARRYDEAIVQLNKTLELDANNAYAHLGLGMCYFWKGNMVDALAEFQKAATLDYLPWYVGSLGFVYGATGDRAKAEQILRDLDELATKQYVSPAARVLVYLGLGEKAKALDWLERCFEEQDPSLFAINGDPLYDSVRNEPRFKALLKKTGLDR